MKKKYLIKTVTYPASQHPERFLNVITDKLEWVMEQYQRNRHPFNWEIVDVEEVDGDVEDQCIEVRYKYTEQDIEL